MSAPGRNDPCWCGSGKKYKKCHWADDQQQAAERARRQEAHSARLESLGSPSETEMRAEYEQMTGRPAPAGPLPATVRETITELWRTDRLAEQARSVLEAERAPWAAHFETHPDEFEAVAGELAADPFFEQFVLSDENMERVERELGSPPDEAQARRAYATQAIALSFDDDDRSTLSRALLSVMADLVDEGRFKEAHVVTQCADAILDAEAPLSRFAEDVVTRSFASE